MNRPKLEWRHKSALLACALVAASLTVAACSSDNQDEKCNCPAGVFVLPIPAARAADVKSVAATGACSKAESTGNGEFSVSEDDTGTCHLTITFESGPAVDLAVMLSRGTTGCASECAPTPTSPVEFPGGTGAAGAGGSQ